MLERSVSEARSELAELANRVAFGGERVVITRHGRPLMALVPVSDLDPSALLDGDDPGGDEPAADEVGTGEAS